MSENKKTLAVSKSLKISKAQQYTLLEVLFASLILGVAIVLSIWLVKYIIFNGKLSTAYSETIEAYETSIINIGVCDPGSDKKLSDAEMEKCNPNSVDIDNVPNSLRYNVLVNVANDANLESVARESQDVCYNEGKKIDFSKEYKNANNEKEKEQALAMMSMCSALRVVPDALPGQENSEATLASLNQVFLLSHVEPESLSVGELDEVEVVEDEAEESSTSSLGIIPISFEVEHPSASIQHLLENMELSIRAFDIKRATFEWSEGKLNMKANAYAYYSGDLTSARKLTKTVYGGDKATTTKSAADMSSAETEEE